MRRSLLYQIGAESDAGEGPSLREWIEEIQLAEKLGVDGIWCLPALDADGAYDVDVAGIWLSALAGTTERIQLGWGVPRMLPPSRPPIRLAERAAALDQSSTSRMALAFLPDAQADSTRDGWLEGLRMLVAMWAPSKFSWDSDPYTVPVVDVLPKPAQSPHPPLSLVGWSAEQARAAGRAGLGCLDVSGAQDAELEVHRDAYHEGRAEVDASELMSHSSFAVSIEFEGAEACRDRQRSCEALGVDELVLRAAFDSSDAESRRARIRALADEPTESH